MEQSEALRLSRELQISPNQIIREGWELGILKELLESSLGKNLIFRGGTALRLAYASPRFSDDLDFSSLTSLSRDTFQKTIQKMARRLPGASVSDLVSKHLTDLAVFRIKEPWQQIGFSIKIEISRRGGYREGAGYELKLLSSPVVNLQVLANVATLETLLEEKRSAFQSRREPRDLFDLWFISQRLGKPFIKPDPTLPVGKLSRELRKYLPKPYWRSLEELGSS